MPRDGGDSQRARPASGAREARRGIAVEVALGKSDELPRKCAVNADTITTIPKRSLAKRIGMLSPEKRAQLDDAVRFALGLDA